MTTWRTFARETIRRVILEQAGKPHAEILVAIDASYPFGQRKYWPYKVWLEERAKAAAELLPITEPTQRPCPACGAKAGRKCRLIEASGQEIDQLHDARINPSDGPLFEQRAP